MKKLLFILLLCTVSTFSFGQSPVILGDLIQCQVCYDHPFGGGSSIPKSPVLVPTISLDNHTLYLYDVDYDLTLVLMDEDDQISYTVFIPANTTSVVLPSWLEGDYLLLLIPDEDYYYVGDISL